MSLEMFPVLVWSVVVFDLVEELVILVMVVTVTVGTEVYAVRFGCATTVTDGSQMMQLQSFHRKVFATLETSVIPVVKQLFHCLTSSSQILALPHNYSPSLFGSNNYHSIVAFDDDFLLQEVGYLRRFINQLLESLEVGVAAFNPNHTFSSLKFWQNSYFCIVLFVEVCVVWDVTKQLWHLFLEIP